ncbi:MAG: sensor histidine kinase [Chroococcales cyanobacterium]
MSKILVIEDDSATRLLLKRDLQLEGYEVILAKNGAEGWDKAQESGPSLIICDWVMPEMDGLALCRQIKADPELGTIFFILLSCRESVAHRIEGLDAGADEFLSKPIDPQELQARVRAGLRQHQLTQQLKVANQQLSDTLEELQQMQMQLIQTEKMSSLGKMIAGIAHEINNPINFIHGNVTYTSNYVQDLLELLSLYQTKYPNPDAEIQSKAEAIDLEFLTQDLMNLLLSTKTGAERIRQLVLNLRNFARLDEAQRKRVNLHEGIDNSLLILQYRLQGGEANSPIEVIKEYGELPLVECYPGQLNQVFFNILMNAIDSLQDSPENTEGLHSVYPQGVSCLVEPKQTANSHSGQIYIRTELQNSNWALISIRDNGPGIPEEVRSKIFDPFFTTKPVGQGTGMGLSLSYEIVVNQHGGKLQCFSSPEQGTELRIEIPLQQNKLMKES